MSIPRVTIGLPVYNGEKYVHEAISSLRAQTYPDLRIAISDNASTDATEEICREHARDDERIVYARADRNHGSSWNYTRTFEMGVGEFFKWAAHDDVVLPTYLERLIEALDDDPGAVLAHSRAAFIDEHGVVLGQPLARNTNATTGDAAERFADILLREFDCLPVFGLIRRDILARTGLLGPFVAHDLPLLAELALYGRFVQVDDVLFHNRDHSDRSVRAYPLKRARLEWFDSSKQGAIALPHTRLVVEYHRTVSRAAVDPRSAREARLVLWSWAARRLHKSLRELLVLVYLRARGRLARARLGAASNG
jgi:glycosyltransferase involved in cell wall biosynthesis